MKTKTLEKFYEAGNSLLKERFYPNNAAIIIVSVDGKITSAIKGKFEDVGCTLSHLCLEDANLFNLLKHTVSYIEKEKAKKNDD